METLKCSWILGFPFPKGNQPWMFTGKTHAEPASTLATWCKELTHWKRPWCWERLRAGAEGDNKGWDGWMASPTWWTWDWVISGSWWWTGRPGVLWFMGSQWSDMTERLKWSELPEIHTLRSQPNRGLWLPNVFNDWEENRCCIFDFWRLIIINSLPEFLWP